jgi:hypothetical protein
MLNPQEQPGLPMIVQIERDWESGRFLALIPASHYPKAAGIVVDPERLDALWAGPLALPSVAGANDRRFPVQVKANGDAGLAA